MLIPRSQTGINESFRSQLGHFFKKYYLSRIACPNENEQLFIHLTITHDINRNKNFR